MAPPVKLYYIVSPAAGALLSRCSSTRSLDRAVVVVLFSVVDLLDRISVFVLFAASAIASESIYIARSPNAPISAVILATSASGKAKNAQIQTTRAASMAQNFRLESFLIQSSLLIVLPVTPFLRRIRRDQLLLPDPAGGFSSFPVRLPSPTAVPGFCLSSSGSSRKYRLRR